MEPKPKNVGQGDWHPTFDSCCSGPRRTFAPKTVSAAINNGAWQPGLHDVPKSLSDLQKGYATTVETNVGPVETNMGLQEPIWGL